MAGILPIALFALAGILIGGCWSLYKQGAKRSIMIVVGLLAVLSAAGGVAWLMQSQA
jgi:hypothetical protein